MKVTFEFCGEDDEYKLESVMNAEKTRDACRGALDAIRQAIKHGVPSVDTLLALEKIRDLIREELAGFDP